MIQSVLVYSMGEVIGDGLIKLPALASLRAAFPGAKLTWAAGLGHTVYATTLAPIATPLLDEILTEGDLGADRRAWARREAPFGGRIFDVVIDTQDDLFRSLAARRAARKFYSPVALFALSSRRPRAPYPKGLGARISFLISLAAGREAPPRPIEIADPRYSAAAAALLPPGPAYVAFAPGSAGAGKRWPLDRYLALARRQESAGRTPVFLLGPMEGEMIEAVRAALPGALLPEIDRVDAFQDIKGPLLVVAMARRFAAAVANDAGPGHMLAAGGAPLLSLQHDRRKSVKFRPAAARLEMLVAKDRDLRTIPVDSAHDALERLLKDTRS